MDILLLHRPDALVEYEEVNEKHFVDSLTLISAIDLTESYKVLDLGTGTGIISILLSGKTELNKI